MLGCVKEVTDFEVTVSLPCGLQGFLSIKNICDSYAKLLSEQLNSTDPEVGMRSVDLIIPLEVIIEFMLSVQTFAQHFLKKSRFSFMSESLYRKIFVSLLFLVLFYV